MFSPSLLRHFCSAQRSAVSQHCGWYLKISSCSPDVLQFILWRLFLCLFLPWRLSSLIMFLICKIIFYMKMETSLCSKCVNEYLYWCIFILLFLFHFQEQRRGQTPFKEMFTQFFVSVYKERIENYIYV